MWKGAVKGKNEACSFSDSFWDCCLDRPPAAGGPGLELNLLCLGLGTELGQCFLLQQSREVIPVYFEGWRVGAGPRGQLIPIMSRRTHSHLGCPSNATGEPTLDLTGQQAQHNTHGKTQPNTCSTMKGPQHQDPFACSHSPRAKAQPAFAPLGSFYSWSPTLHTSLLKSSADDQILHRFGGK